ncbi:MAG: restriction endonuclease subunit S [Candidatus Paceibacterota bacterium]
MIVKKNTIPVMWQVKTIDQVCKNLDNLRVPISKEKRIKGDVPYYGATGVLDHVAGHIFDEELLLIGEDGADWSKFAKTAYLIEGKSWVNNHAHALKCKQINPVYLKEYLNFNDLNLYVTGGTRGKLTKGILSKIPVLVPPPTEQKKIAEILACVDEDIDKTDEIIKKTQKLKKGLMQELLSRGIGHTKFKKTKLGEIPQEWKAEKIRNICEIVSGSTPKTVNGAYWNGKIVWVTPADLSKRKSKYLYDSDRHITKEGFEGCSTVMVPKKSLIMSSRAPIGYLTINEIEATTNQGCKSFICKDIDVEYLYYFLSYNVTSIKNLGSGSTFLEVGRKELEKIDVPMPRPEEQKQIAEILSAVDDKININKQIKSKLTELKKGLMQDLLSGEIRVKI